MFFFMVLFSVYYFCHIFNTVKYASFRFDFDGWCWGWTQYSVHAMLQHSVQCCKSLCIAATIYSMLQQSMQRGNSLCNATAAHLILNNPVGRRLYPVVMQLVKRWSYSSFLKNAFYYVNRIEFLLKVYKSVLYVHTALDLNF